MRGRNWIFKECLLLGYEAVWLLLRKYISEKRIAFFRSVLRLLVTVNVVPSSLILSTLMTEAIRSSETSVLTRATQRNIPEDGIFYSRRRESLRSYIALTGWAL
jgi:hypothetical protein